MSEQKLEKQLIILDRLYQLYDEECSKFYHVCQIHCADCCTRNVIITTLEGYHIVKQFEKKNNSDLLDKIKTLSTKKRFIPKLTTNQFVDYCIEDKEIPEEENDSSWGACPLLEDDACPTYSVRPFGCRCFLSQKKCSEFGEAFQSPYLMTMNTIFLQYIEYLDQDGYTGNFSDVLLFLENKENLTKYISNSIEHHPNLIPNRSIKALMIPPEHEQEGKALVQKIHSLF